MMGFARLGYRLWIIWAILNLASCATWHNIGKSDADILKERAQARWNALINMDWAAAYQYELPVYRQTHDEKQYRARFGTKVQWKSVEVKNISIVQDDKIGDVELRLVYQIMLAGEQMENDSEVKERWLKQEGTWWVTN